MLFAAREGSLKGRNRMTRSMNFGRLTAIGIAVAMGTSILATPVAARASEEGRRNTTLALGAAAAALLLTQKNKLPGIVAGAGAAYAYSRYNDSVKSRHDREDYYYGRNGRDRYGDRYNRDEYRYDNRNDRYDNRYDRNRIDDRHYSRKDSRYYDRDDHHNDRRR
jgi:hypothetical protein